MHFAQLQQLGFPIVSQGHQANWQPALAQNLPANALLSQWLLDPNSLTAKLKRHCQNFSVEVLGQRPGLIRPDEANWLTEHEHPNNEQANATIREVILCCDHKPWVFARSVFPQSALDEAALKLGQLGDKPLGAHLFAQPDLQRSRIEVSRFAAQSRIGELHQCLGYPAQSLWGRRSCFTAAGQRVLVAEVFIGESIPAQIAATLMQDNTHE